ncbi:CYTH domain-containing protein [Actinomadura yumaensis]|uniref:CYTH domain-containing protein n=1 Tax=Actinomadura yumaensis TaxID=111807 RepID=UPI0036235A7D
MAVKHLEIERKYDAAADFGLPDLSGLPGVASIAGPRTHGLHATYFDTADLRLAAHGITLRRRRGGDDAGWHLKIPAGPDSKQELRAPLGRARIVPARLASLVAAYTRGEPLLPVATLETERTVVRLLDASGETLAEVADDAVSGRDLRGAARVTAPPEVTGQAMPFSSRSAASGATANDADADADGLVSRAPGEPGSVANTGNANGVVTVIDAEGTGVVPAGVPVGEALAPAAAWREIEVELVAGTQELLKAAGKRLRKAGASRAGSSSKLGRLLNDAIEPPPRRRPARTPRSGSAPRTARARPASPAPRPRRRPATPWSRTWPRRWRRS